LLFTGCEAGAAGAEGAAGEVDPGGAGGDANVPGAWTGAAAGAASGAGVVAAGGTGAGLAGMKSGPFCPHPAISATLAIRIALQGAGK
jgi:hypothetical protein